MATETLPEAEMATEQAVPMLRSGDHMDQPTFARFCESMAEDCRAELVGGLVIMVPLTSANHGDDHGSIIFWLKYYAAFTHGVRALDDATVILGPESQPRPDGVLLVRPEVGGQTRIEGGVVAGPPELIVEVAYSSYAYDLHSKKLDYQLAGVREYIVLVQQQRRIEWFVSRAGRFESHAPGGDGLYRSIHFPGLWLDPSALIGRDDERLFRAAQRGLESPEHADFVAQFQARRTP